MLNVKFLQYKCHCLCRTSWHISRERIFWNCRKIGQCLGIRHSIHGRCIILPGYCTGMSTGKKRQEVIDATTSRMLVHPRMLILDMLIYDHFLFSLSRIEAVANYIDIKFEPGKGLFQYEVKFSPDIDSRPLRRKLLNQHSADLGRTKTFDGTLLYLPIRLPQDVSLRSICSVHVHAMQIQEM